ncbi:MAG: hypothetical protein PF569_02520 [Candidatus Woesearchaeota archaeon]|jgi:hypothetical protein|nr:hypothetical protein [Candidatus Woesearchaeota archaeon]
MKSKTIEIKEILTKIDDLYRCAISDEHFLYFKKYDSLRTTGSKSVLFIRAINVKNQTYDITVTEGNLLLNTPYKYASNYDPVPYDIQDKLSLLSNEEYIEFYKGVMKAVQASFNIS